jgi:hypothetical protein
MRRLTRDQVRLIIDLLDKEIYELCARLDPHRETYVGPIQHDLAEDRLSQAVSAREKLIARLPENFTPLPLVKGRSQPRFHSLFLAQKFEGDL